MIGQLIDIVIGFAAGIFLTMGLCWWWIQNYTTEQDQKKAAFGNTRYQEGFTQGEATGIQTGHIDGWQDGWEAKEGEVEYQKRQELK
jgi:hypothetical protein